MLFDLLISLFLFPFTKFQHPGSRCFNSCAVVYIYTTKFRVLLHIYRDYPKNIQKYHEISESKIYIDPLGFASIVLPTSFLSNSCWYSASFQGLPMAQLWWDGSAHLCVCEPSPWEMIWGTSDGGDGNLAQLTMWILENPIVDICRWGRGEPNMTWYFVMKYGHWLSSMKQITVWCCYHLHWGLMFQQNCHKWRSEMLEHSEKTPDVQQKLDV